MYIQRTAMIVSFNVKFALPEVLWKKKWRPTQQNVLFAHITSLWYTVYWFNKYYNDVQWAETKSVNEIYQNQTNPIPNPHTHDMS